MGRAQKRLRGTTNLGRSRAICVGGGSTFLRVASNVGRGRVWRRRLGVIAIAGGIVAAAAAITLARLVFAPAFFFVFAWGLVGVLLEVSGGASNICNMRTTALRIRPQCRCEG